MENFIAHLDENWPAYLRTALGILFTWVAAQILVRIVRKLIARGYARRGAKLAPDKQRKLETASSIMQSASKYAIWFLAIAAMMGQLGLTATMNSMLAAAGVGGLALGIGAQSFIKDVVAGLFFVFEDQLAVGDYVDLGGTTGTIDEISLRTVVVKGVRGELTVVPNGTISVFTNYSRSDLLAFVDVEIAYETDAERAMQVMLEEAEAYAKDYAFSVDPPNVLGITTLGQSGVTVRLTMRVKPLKHWETERALRLRILNRFKKEGIEIPYNKLVLYTDGANENAPPGQGEKSGGTRQ